MSSVSLIDGHTDDDTPSMTYKEAIENINDILNSPYLYDESIDYQLTTDDIECLEMSKQALEKQIPKNPFQASQPCFYWCPNCKSAIKKRIENSARIIENCPFCGQALDWGDNE